MSAKPETNFRRRVVAFLHSLEPKIYYTSVQQKSISGTPDILACIRGNFTAIEIKARGGKLTPLQAYAIQRIIDADGVAVECNPDNFEIFKKLITELNDDSEIKQKHN